MSGSKSKNRGENRNSTRFQVQDNVFAILKQPQYRELGKILDISESGISFLCINEGDWDVEPFSIDLIFSEEKKSGHIAILKDIPLKPISYCKKDYCPPEPGSQNMSLSRQFKRCGVAFADLDKEQRSLLDVFIASHAVARA
ncbi:PilZ domain-containing protein [Desulfobacterota bacterium M19]